MNQKYLVKQEATSASTYFGYYGQPTSPNITVHPNADHKRYVRKEADGRTWVTGLNENSPRVRSITDKSKREKLQKEIVERRKRLENLLGLDLSANPKENPEQDFWFTTPITLVPRGGNDIVWDLSDPLTEVFYWAAIENRFIAPSYEELKTPPYMESNCFLYFFNPQFDTSRQNVLQDLQDDVAALLSTYKNNKEKIFYWCSAAGLSVNRNMDKDTMLSVLRSYRSKLKTIPEFESFKTLLELNNQQLLIKHLITWAVKHRHIKKQGNFYMFNNQELGVKIADVEEALLSGNHDDVVDQLIRMENPSK